MEQLNNHVSVRKFSQKVISKELLESVVFSGTRASTTGNMQLYSVVVTEAKDGIDRLAPFHFNQPVSKTAPVLLTIVADFNRFSQWCVLNKAEPGYNNMLSFTTAVIDALLFAQNICVAAENNGLGICYLGTTTYNAEGIINELKLPKLTFPITTIALGYPEETPELTDRIPLEGVIHYEKYNNYTKGDIANLHAYKESLESSKRFVEENAKESLAQVFTDVRYKKADNEFFSAKMLETLKKQGFLI